MTRALSWSEDAQRDAAVIVDFITLNVGPVAAEEWLVGISASMYQVLMFPESAPRYPSMYDSETRGLVFRRRYRVVYRVYPDAIHVVAIHDCRSLPPPLP